MFPRFILTPSPSGNPWEAGFQGRFCFQTIFINYLKKITYNLFLVKDGSVGNYSPNPYPCSSLALLSWRDSEKSQFTRRNKTAKRDSGESRHGIPVSCNHFRMSPTRAHLEQELACGGPAFGGPAFGGPAFGGPAFGGPAFGGPAENHLFGMGNQEAGFRPSLRFVRPP